MRSPDAALADDTEAPDDVALCAEDDEDDEDVEDDEDDEDDDVDEAGVDDEPPHAARPSVTAAASAGAQARQRTL
jgi:hypothetical protein